MDKSAPKDDNVPLFSSFSGITSSQKHDSKRVYLVHENNTVTNSYASDRPPTMDNASWVY